MPERIIRGYKVLFEVKLLNHYWLDWGDTFFDELPENAAERQKLPSSEKVIPTKEELLSYYDSGKLISVHPSAATEKQMTGLGCLLLNTSQGFVVVLPGEEELPDIKFDFILKIQDPAFLSYTSYFLRKQEIVELSDPAKTKIYRYKKLVPVFSNRTGSLKNLHGKDVLFLSKPYTVYQNNNDYAIESLVVSGNTLYESTCEEPGGLRVDWRKLKNESICPVFFHQDDIQDIVFPAGINGQADKGIELSDSIPDDIFALIRIEKLDDADSLRLTDGLSLRSPVFEIRFKNRSTLWKYYNKKTGEIESTETESLPLTCFGNAGSQQKAAAESIKSEFKDSDVTKIKSLFSEIYI
jgi:hypothetical protein